MPSLSLLRIAGLNYNDGKTRYEDMLIDTKDNSTLVDFENGGGKSLLLQCIAQTIMPLSKLQNDWDYQKLYKKEQKNTTVNIATQWKLEDNFKYRNLITGFCSYQRPGNMGEILDEDEVSRAVVDYFNYIILFNSDSFSVEDLPFKIDDANASYSDISAYLKKLKNSTGDVYVKKYDKKAEYQKDIAKYSLNLVEWEILRRINKAEGYTPTYFRERCPKSKDFIFNFLVDIIDKCYESQMSTDYQNSEQLASSLIVMRERLSELSKKREQSLEYEMIAEFLVDLSMLMEQKVVRLKEKERLQLDILKNYNYLCLRGEELEAVIDKQKISLSTMQSELTCLSKEKRTLDILEKNLILANLENERELRLVEIEAVREKIVFLKDKEREMKALNDYIAYIEKSMLKQAEMSKLSDLEKEDSFLVKEITTLGINIRAYIEKDLRGIDSKINKYVNEGKELEQIISIKQSDKNDISVERGVLLQEVKRCEKENSNLENILLSNKFSELETTIKSRESLKFHVKELEAIGIKIIENKESLVDTKAISRMTSSELRATSEKYSHAKSMLKIKQETLEEYMLDKNNVDMLVKDKYDYEDLESLLVQIKTLVGDIRNYIFDTEKKIGVNEEAIRQFANNTISINQKTIEVFEVISEKYKSAILGNDFISSLSAEEKKKFLERNELIPYGILLSKKDFNNIKKSDIFEDFEEYLIPIIDKEALLSQTLVYDNAVYFPVRDSKKYIDIEYFDKQIEDLTQLNKEFRYKVMASKEELGILEKDLCVVERFLLKYDKNHLVVLNESLLKLKHEKVVLEGDLDRLVKIDKELLDLLNEHENSREVLDTTKDTLNRKIDLLKEYLLNDEKRKSNEERLLILEVEINESLEYEKLIANDLIESQEKYTQLQRTIRNLHDGRNDRNVEFLEYDRYKDKEVTEILDVNSFAQNKSLFKSKVKVLNDKNKDLAEIEEVIRNLSNDEKRFKEYVNREGFTLEEMALKYSKNNIGYSRDEILGCKTQYKSIENIHRELNDKREAITGRINLLLGEIKTRKSSLIGKYKESYETVLGVLIRKHGKIEDNVDYLINDYISKMQEKEALIFEEKNNLRLSEQELKIIQKEVVDSRDIIAKETIDKNLTNKTEKLEINYKKMAKEFGLVKSEITFINLKYERKVSHMYDNCSSMHLHDIQDAIRPLLKFEDTIDKIEDSIERSVGGADCLLNQINREKASIEEKIVELKQSESAFVDLCIQKCSNVYRDIKKLPGLSEITINGKRRRMIELKIEMLPEEECRERVANYIEGLIKNAEKSDNPKLTIAQGLTTESLFRETIYTVKNSSVKVYKVEKIEDESNNRMLPWSDAIGSQGQSNSIYMALLICLISYIRKLYANDSKETVKFIMLDNPFGATGLEDLWYPIVQLMNENNVQLLTVGYDVKSSLSNCFDTRYLLRLAKHKKVQRVEVAFNSNQKYAKENDALRGEQVSYLSSMKF